MENETDNETSRSEVIVENENFTNEATAIDEQTEIQEVTTEPVDEIPTAKDEEKSEEKKEEEKEEEMANKWVWYPDDKLVWNRGLVVSTTYVDNPKGPAWREYLIAISQNPPIIRKIRSDKVHRVDPTHLNDLDNLCLMNDMHEAPLLDLLHRRFDQKVIYTYTGDVLISVNPYELIPGLYSNPLQHFNIFAKGTSSEIARNGEEDHEVLKPHVFQISNKSLRSLVYGTVVEENSSFQKGENYFNQSIIISGESGAGKTENSKHVVNFLIEANNYLTKQQITNTSSEERFAEYLKGILIESSVILEAFGNAKTVRNDNSSRFGKYIKLLYNSVEGNIAPSHGRPPLEHIPKLVSAIIETFLLEKSRLSYVGQGERSYHVFYQLLIGITDPQLKSLFGLTEAKNFRMLAQGGCFSTDEDRHEYANSLKALQTLQCSDAEIHEIWKLLATILHLGNLEYGKDETASDAAQVLTTVESPTYTLEQIAENLGVGIEKMITSLTTQQLVVMKRSSIKVKILSKADVANNVSALIKWLYSKLFDWIVSKINYCFITTSSVNHKTSRHGFIGILDIFGFEILGVNSFEQLCINFTNERLQQQFNEFVFITEQSMYRSEGLEWSNITFKDNQPVIDLIASTKKPLGLLPLLEEQGMLNRKPDDIALLATFNQVHELKDAKGRVIESIYSKSRFGKDAFTIKHFAGEVTYAVDGFLLKNNDSLQDDLIVLLNTSTNPFLRNVMKFGDSDPDQLGFIPNNNNTATAPAVESSRTTASGKKMASAISVSLQFRQQLDSLMATLTSTSPNYIKCVKPNPLKSKGIFDPHLVIQQLRYSGVLEVVRIRREGFPVRITFQAFYRDFEILARGKPKDLFPGPDNCDFEQAKKCAGLIASSALAPDVFQVGHSLLFLRQNGLILMQEAVRNFYSNQLIKIQSKYRSVLIRRQYLIILSKALILSRQIRRYTKRVIYKRIRRAALTIKYFYISKRLRQKFVLQYQELLSKRRLKSAIVIQTIYRGMKQRRAYKVMYKAWIKLKYKSALVIQCCFRCFKSRKIYHFKLQEHSVIKLQSIFRMKLQRDQYLLILTVAVAIQSVLRKFIYRCRYLHSRRNIIRLQSLSRRYLAIIHYRRQRNQIILVQSFIRRYLAKISVLIQQAAIVCLQTWTRTRLAHYQYQQQRKRVILGQSLIRAYLFKKWYREILRKAVKLQAKIRCFLSHRNYQIQYSAILCLQAFGRMINGRRRYQEVLVATITIQSKIRLYLNKRRYHLIRKKIIIIEAIVRGFLERRRYRKVLLKLVLLQSFGRMINARRVYTAAVISIIICQSMVRRYLARHLYKKQRNYFILLQSHVRRYLCQLHYRYQYKQVIKLQALGRMINNRRAYNEILVSTIILQTITRGYLTKRIYRFLRSQIIRLQSWYRMYVAKTAYQITRQKIIKLQSHARKYNAMIQYQISLVSILCIQAIVRRGINRNRYLIFKAACVMIQSHIRKYLQYRRYRGVLKAETIIGKYYRRFLCKRFYKKCIRSVKRIQLAVNRFLKNLHLRNRLEAFHNLCMELQPGTGKTNPTSPQPTPQQKRYSTTRTEPPRPSTSLILSHLLEFPEDRYIRLRKQSLKSMLHSLIVSSQDEVLSKLNITCQEIFEYDLRGRNASHYFGMYPNMKCLSVIAESINQLRFKSAVTNMDVLDFDDDNDNDNDTGGGGGGGGVFAQIKEQLHKSVGSSSLKSGWLKKKRGGMMWQKRWVVLTEDYIIYYKNPQSINNPKFAIPLEGCTVQRLPGSRDPIVELIAPNMGEKKTIFGSSTKKSMNFLAESEKDLQEWLMPLKAVAGVGTFRSTPVKYIHTDLRRLWLQVADIENETPLHYLVKAIAGQLTTSSTRSNYIPKPMNVDEAIHMICWMVEFGCSVNAQNICGETALLIAVNGNIDKRIVRSLMVKGADPRIANLRGIAPMELMNNNPEKKKLYYDVVHALTNMKSNLKPAPSAAAGSALSVTERNFTSAGKLKGYSYLSFFFSSLNFLKAPLISEDPSIVISVYNDKKQLLETARDIRAPANVVVEEKGGTILWGQSWHMQTPLENLEPNSYIVIEYRPRGELITTATNSPPPTSPSAATFLIDLNTIDSSFQSFDLLPVTEPGKQTNPILLNQEKLILNAELVLSRRNRSIDYKTIICS